MRQFVVRNLRKSIENLNKRIDELEAGDLDILKELLSALEFLLEEVGDPTPAIDKYNEIISFLDLMENTSKLKSLLDDIRNSIPEAPVQSDWAEDDVNDQAYIKNKPTIPTKLSDLQNDAGFAPISGTVNANGHDYVEIAGVKWATKNVGALTETDCGLYFLWGDSLGYTADQCGTGEGQRGFSWQTYKFAYSDLNDSMGNPIINYTKYDAGGLTILDPEDDAATVNMGGGWRMPTNSEVRALFDACNIINADGTVIDRETITSIQWETTLNGMKGLYLEDKTDHSKRIFFPTAGYLEGSSPTTPGKSSYYDAYHPIVYWLKERGHNGGSSNGFADSFGVILSYNRKGMACPVRGILDETNTLHKVATSGDYNDLSNKPNLSTVATTGSYNDLTDKPTIPTKVSDLTNNSDFLKNPHISNGHEYVEIAGMKWATMNIGATSTTDKGLYFSWGETVGYPYNTGSDAKSFSLSDYKYAEFDGSNYIYTKYNDTDQKTLLDLEDDPARVNWGGNWRMPTEDEFKALKAACDVKILLNDGTTTINSTPSGKHSEGIVFIDKTDSTKYIIFPFSQREKDGHGPTSTSDAANMFSLWLNKCGYTTHKGYETVGCIVYTNGVWDRYIATGTEVVYAGLPVRPILDEQSTPSTVSEVAITGDYNDLVNKPTIPTKLSDLIDDISSNVPQQQSTNEKGHNFVEIGGIKWSTMNLGANNETDYGLYFLWGDTQGYASNQIGTGEGLKYFVENNYKFYRKGTGYTGSTVNDYNTKYCRYDKKAILDLSDDAANVMWGGSWRIPTALDFKKLLDATTNQWVTNYNDSGINGILFTGKQNTSDSGKTLFFPAASGYYQGGHDYLGNENENGYYFSRDVLYAETSLTSDRAYSLKFNQNSVQVESNNRSNGIVIRPVIESKPKDNSNNCEYVDLGLPSGLLWAKRNVTRNNQNPYDTSSNRNFFSWGNIDNCNQCLSGLTAYSASNGAKLTGNIPADSKYDAVRYIMGGDWRMPTKKEAQELIDNCTFSYNDAVTLTNSVTITATSNINGNSITFSGDVLVSDEKWYTSSLFTMIWLSDIYDDTKAYRLYLGVSLNDRVNVNANVSQTTRYTGTYIHGVLDSVKPITNLLNDENLLLDLKQEISNSFEILKKPEPNTNAHEYVDLGLPSNKLWAKCNIGALNESDFGLYFQWGDTLGYTSDQCGTEEGQKAFKWSDYKYGDGTDDLSGTGLSKYNQTDEKSVLDAEDDPASVVWGGNWRTPTKAEYEELLTYTTWEDVVINNMRGLKCVSIYDKSKYIFIPFSGVCYDGEFSWGSYTLTGTTSTLNTENSTSKYKVSYAWGSFNDEMYTVSRCKGTTIRAILDGYPNQTSVVAATGDYNDLINKPSSATIRKIELTQNLVDQTTTISGQSNDGKREIIIYDNTSQNDYTVSISTSYKTVDGNQIVLSVPAGCYGEVCYTNIGGTIFAKGIKQLANN